MRLGNRKIPRRLFLSFSGFVSRWSASDRTVSVFRCFLSIMLLSHICGDHDKPPLLCSLASRYGPVHLATHIVTFRATQFVRCKAQFAGNVGYLSKNCNAAAGELGGSLRASRQDHSAALRFLDLGPLSLRKRALLSGSLRLAECYNMSGEVH